MASVVAAWPTVALSEVLRKSDEWVDINPDTEYTQVTVRLWGKGVAQRGRVLGSQIAASRQLVVSANQFILSRIDARNGAFGLITSELDGAVVSNDFPVFNLDENRIIPAYLDWLSKTHDFVEMCQRASEGTTNRVRLKEDRFLGASIPLPPLDEQRRIVAHIEALAARIAEARELRQAAMAEAEALWKSALLEAFTGAVSTQRGESARDILAAQASTYASAVSANFNGAHPARPHLYNTGPTAIPDTWIWTDLGSVLTHFIDCVNDTPDFASSDTGLLGLKSTNIRPYKLDLSMRWFVDENDFSKWTRREKPLAGDLVLTREAPMGNVCLLPEGLEICLTQRLMLLRADEMFVSPRYLLHFLNSAMFQAQVLEQCRGLTTPHIRVKDAPLLRVPLAPRQEQRGIVEYLDDMQTQVNVLKCQQYETAAELDALLPSVLDKAFRGEL